MKGFMEENPMRRIAALPSGGDAIRMLGSGKSLRTIDDYLREKDEKENNLKKEVDDILYRSREF